MADTNVSIVITAKDLASKTLQDLDHGFSKIGKSAQNFSNDLKLIGTATIAAAGGLVALATKSAFSAARVEELTFALHAVAKANDISQQAVDESVQKLRDMNIAHEKALQISSLFMQSQLDLADAIKLANVAKDLAVISGMDSSEATRVLTESIASQSVIMLRQFGIVTTLDDLYESFGATIGKTSDELTEAEKKQAFLNRILESGEKVAGTYDAAMNSVSKRFRSLTGRIIPDFIAQVGKAFTPALTVIIDAISNSIKKLSDWVAENEGKIAEWGVKLGEAVSKGITLFGQLVNFLMKNKEIVIGVFVALGIAVGAVAVAFIAAHAVIILVFTAIVAGVALVVKYMPNLIEVFKAFIQFIDSTVVKGIKGFINILSSLVKYFRDVTQTGDYLNDWITHLPTPIQGVVKAIGKFVSLIVFLTRYIVFLLKTGDYLNDWITYLPGPIQTVIKVVGGFISIIINLIRYFSDLLRTGDYLNDWITHLPSPIQGIVKTIGKFISVIVFLKRYITDLIKTGDYLNDWITHLPTPIQGIVKVIGKFISFIVFLTRYIIDLIKTGDYLNDWITYLPKPLQIVFRGIGDFINLIINLTRYISDFIRTGDWLNDWITYLPGPIQTVLIAFGKFVDFIKSLPGIVLNFISQIPDAIYKFFVIDIPYALGFAYGRFLKFFTVDIPNAWNAFVNFLTVTVPALAEQFGIWFTQMCLNALNALWEFATVTAPNAINSFIQWLIVNIPIMANNFVNWIVQMVVNAWNALVKFKDDTINTLIKWKNSLITTVIELYNNFIKWITQLINDVIDGLLGMPGKVKDAMDKVKEAAINKAKEIYEGVKGWFDKIINFFGDIIDAAGRAIDRAKEAFRVGKEAGYRYQTGGIVPGPVGAPVPILAHGGEKVTPSGLGTTSSGGQIVFNVSIGLYAGTETEKRNIAKRLYSSLLQVAQSQHATVAELMGG